MAALLLPAPATAAPSCAALPGSGVDQYCETIPAAGGSQAVADQGTRALGPAGSGQGPGGSGLAGGSGPAPITAEPRGARHRRTAPIPGASGRPIAAQAADIPSGGAIAAIQAIVGPPLFWLIVVLVLALCAAAAWLELRRRRRATGEDETSSA